ncbi:MAG: DUF362 domain-containing protein [Desulfobacteraceae bacterium]|jgi:uncharacterized protein (DUF362 family)
MEKQVVAIKRYEKSPDTLRELIELCEGFDRLKPDQHVFIKPNLVALDDKYPMSLYGVYTTSRLVQDMVILLKAFGVEKITIGEGAVRGKDFGVPTDGIYDFLGYPFLKARYGVRLIDLLKGPFEKVDFGEFQLQIAKPALEADFFINMPALKTHNQAVLSLGLKNLKGCLSIKSRKFCHGSDESLDHHLSFFVEKLNPGLTVLDGIYGLEKGPFYLGKAVRMNALVGSKDALAADVIGAALAGIEPQNVPHIKEYADRHNRSLSVEDFDIKGTPISELGRKLKWDNTWREDNTGPRAWDRIGIQGVSLPKYDKTLCTGCSGLYGPILAMIMSAFKGTPFDEIEVLTGKSMKPSGQAKKTVLFGNCMIKAHRKDTKIKEAIFTKGCPPSLQETEKAMNECGIQANLEFYKMFRDSLMDRYKGKEGFDERLYFLG